MTTKIPINRHPIVMGTRDFHCLCDFIDMFVYRPMANYAAITPKSVLADFRRQLDPTAVLVTTYDVILPPFDIEPVCDICHAHIDGAILTNGWLAYCSHECAKGDSVQEMTPIPQKYRDDVVNGYEKWLKSLVQKEDDDTLCAPARKGVPYLGSIDGSYIQFFKYDVREHGVMNANIIFCFAPCDSSADTVSLVWDRGNHFNCYLEYAGECDD